MGQIIWAYLAPLVALSAALVYSLLAGFSLPTQRALIALSVVILAKLRFRRIQPVACFCWSLFLLEPVFDCYQPAHGNP